MIPDQPRRGFETALAVPRGSRRGARSRSTATAGFSRGRRRSAS